MREERRRERGFGFAVKRTSVGHHSLIQTPSALVTGPSWFTLGEFCCSCQEGDQPGSGITGSEGRGLSGNGVSHKNFFFKAAAAALAEKATTSAIVAALAAAASVEVAKATLLEAATAASAAASATAGASSSCCFFCHYIKGRGRGRCCVD